jgi:CO/xanthine dehydrogenase Mo-binding subunit
MTTYNVIGKKAARKDGPAKVTGKAKFAYDVALPGMLHAKSVRSPLPYARIVKIDISKALALPGVHAVLTGADIAGHVYGNRVRDVPVLANGVVRFIGEKVAAVVADPTSSLQTSTVSVTSRLALLKPIRYSRTRTRLSDSTQRSLSPAPASSSLT